MAILAAYFLQVYIMMHDTGDEAERCGSILPLSLSGQYLKKIIIIFVKAFHNYA